MRWLVLSSHDAWQERRLGIQTAGLIHRRDLGLSENCESYEPIDYNTFAGVLQRISVRPDDVFLDYGSGLGRVIILAARQPFQRVIGVELSSRLCALAENNVKVARRRLTCPSIDIINSDACEYVVPAQVSIIWLFSPFFGEVMEAVTERIRQSLAAQRRELTVIHVVPDNIPSVFLQCDWLQESARFRVGLWKQLTCLIFTSRAPNLSPSATV